MTHAFFCWCRQLQLKADPYLMKSSTTNSACQHLSIAQSKIGEVMVCPECGVVHLALQSISMRFDLEAFNELATMIGQAKATIIQARKFTLMSTNGLNITDQFVQDSTSPDCFSSNHSHKVH
jgi:hypothetical protein